MEPIYADCKCCFHSCLVPAHLLKVLTKSFNHLYAIEQHQNLTGYSKKLILIQYSLFYTQNYPSFDHIATNIAMLIYHIYLPQRSLFSEYKVTEN